MMIVGIVFGDFLFISFHLLLSIISEILVLAFLFIKYIFSALYLIGLDYKLLTTKLDAKGLYPYKEKSDVNNLLQAY